jgi:hypothetical protein
LKISTTFVLVPYSDSVYKTPKTHFDLLLLKTATRRKNFLTCTRRWAAAAGEGRGGAQGTSGGGRKKYDWRKELVTVVSVYREKLIVTKG